MKFKIRYADQLVGIISMAGVAALIVLIIAISASKNWFTKKMNYYTIFDSGSGISTGMELTYKGFSIGKVKSVSLEGHMVRVDYYILGKYEDYVKEGSLVQLITSPIGLGSSFVFHPGLGTENISSGSEIYRLNSFFGQEILDKKLNFIEDQSDSIGVLMNKVSTLLDNLNQLLASMNSGINDEGLLKAVLGDQLAEQLLGLISNLNSITKSADSIIGTADPEVQNLLTQLETTLIQANDVLEGVKNNPLIKNGVPDHSNQNAATGTSSKRKYDF